MYKREIHFFGLKSVVFFSDFSHGITLIPHCHTIYWFTKQLDLLIAENASGQGIWQLGRKGYEKSLEDSSESKDKNVLGKKKQRSDTIH